MKTLEELRSLVLEQLMTIKSMEAEDQQNMKKDDVQGRIGLDRAYYVGLLAARGTHVKFLQELLDRIDRV